ncbi:hypothetical protein NPIL_338281 [Nephila pilipes]|uniref:Uncharacterized protein n=1 Tax=Nephila pilipes TaxID=299642 RepID=A0A8X6U4Z0_NEPPI|nr:hypothetical protein NPIL_338281 [Nephila pilipes]
MLVENWNDQLLFIIFSFIGNARENVQVPPERTSWVARSQLSLLSVSPDSDEGEIEERRPLPPRKGKRRIPGACQAATPPLGHHKPVGQGLHHPTHHLLLEDEGSLPQRSASSLSL